MTLSLDSEYAHRDWKKDMLDNAANVFKRDGGDWVIIEASCGCRIKLYAKFSHMSDFGRTMTLDVIWDKPMSLETPYDHTELNVDVENKRIYLLPGVGEFIPHDGIDINITVADPQREDPIIHFYSFPDGEESDED